MKKLSRFIVSAVLICCMIVSVVPLGVLAATDNTQQIAYRGGTTGNNDGVEVSKVITPTDKENYFEITLTAKTRETNSISISKQETDVVIVMDISNTMNDKPGTSSVPKDNNTRIHAAQEAAKSFTEKYCSYNSENGYKGKLSVVTFNTNADTVIPLTDATNSTKKNLKAKIDGIAPKGKISYTYKTLDDYAVSGDRFTNIEAGLRLAGNILGKSKAANKIVVLITDGFPTTYIKSSANSLTKISGYNPYTPSGKYGVDGVFYDPLTKRHCDYGTNYSDKAATKAQNISAKLKEKGISVFSIGVDVGGQSIGKYVENGVGKNFSTVDCYSESTRKLLGLTDYVIGSGKNSYVNWLGKTIAGGKAFDGIVPYADGNNSGDLNKAFDNIYSAVVSTNQKSNNNDLVVTDPMGPEIEFIDWSNEADGNEKNFLDASETINWNLMKSTCKTDTKNGVTTYTYSLTYKVRLENEKQGFDPDATYTANGKTTLKYKVIETGKQPTEKSIDFLLPTIKGYLADFSFNKKGSDGKALSGAEFVIHHDSNCCNVNINDVTVKSDGNGIVSFSNIPSGHKYTLKEAKSVAGYYIADTQKTYTVDVAYGTVKILGGSKDLTKNFTVINERKAPAKVTLEASKIFDGKTPDADLFEFELLDKDSNVIDTSKNDNAGNITFKELSFDEVGSYEYTIREKNTGGEDIVYDTSVHSVKINVTEGDKDYIATVVYDGKVDAPVFENRTAKPAEFTITAQKTLDGGALSEDMFTFELYDEAGALLESVKNDANGKISFSPLTLDKEGTYKYTVKELKETKDFVFDTTVYEVTAVVEREIGGDYKIVSTTYTTDGETVDSISFNNKVFTPDKGQITVDLEKYLDGNLAGGFSFDLKGVENGLNDSRIDVGNDGKGKFVLNFDDNDIGNTYNYKITEIKGMNENILYDSSEYTLTVTVNRTLGENYQITTGLKKDGKSYDTAVFKNMTKPPVVVIEEETPQSPVTPVTPTKPAVPTVTVIDETPLGTVKTMDENHVTAALIMTGVCAAGILVVSDKRKKSNEE